jgi:hypothetical protein
VKIIGYFGQKTGIYAGYTGLTDIEKPLIILNQTSDTHFRTLQSSTTATNDTKHRLGVWAGGGSGWKDAKMGK